MTRDPFSRAGCHAPNKGDWSLGELVAMIGGFVLFWPLGLAIVLWKIWQKKQGYSGDLFAFLREQADGVRQGWSMNSAATASSYRASSGNVAFDEWREAELARLEEERRKLAEAEQAFARHIDELRRARDREEFDAFMRNRSGRV